MRMSKSWRCALSAVLLIALVFALVFALLWEFNRRLELEFPLPQARDSQPGTPPLQTWKVGVPVASVAFDPTGQLVAVGSDNGGIQLRQVTDGRVVRTLVGHTNRVKTLAFSPDGRALASGSGGDWQVLGSAADKKEATVRLWRVEDGALLHTLDGYS